MRPGPGWTSTVVPVALSFSPTTGREDAQTRQRRNPDRGKQSDLHARGTIRDGFSWTGHLASRAPNRCPELVSLCPPHSADPPLLDAGACALIVWAPFPTLGCGKRCYRSHGPSLPMWLFAPEGSNQNGIADRSRQVTLHVYTAPSRSLPGPPWCGNFSAIPVSPSHGLPPDAMGLAKVDLDHGYLVVRSAPRQIQLSSPRSPPFSSRQGVPPFVPGDPSPSDRFPISRVMFGVGRQPGAAGASRGLPSTYIRFPACLPRSVCSCMTAVLDSCRRLHATLLPGLPLPRPQQPICWSFTQYFVSRLR